MSSPLKPRLGRMAVLVLAGLLLVHLGTSPALERRGAPSPLEPERHAAVSAAPQAHPPTKALPGPTEDPE